MKNILLFSLLALALASCRPSPSAGDRLRVTVTIEPLRYFVERIGGDRLQVTTMVPVGGNPETYEPSAQQLVGLAESPLYVCVGSIGFERTWLAKLQANAPKTTFVNASAGITPIRDEHGDEDPHTWMSARNARIMAQNICEALTEAAPADSAAFRANLKALLADIDRTDRQVRSTLNGGRQSFLIYHPILTYFAADYRLTQLSVEREGREPSAADLQGVIQKARQQQAGVLFVQREFASRNIEVVQRAVGVRSVVINPLSYDWQTEMLHIANELK